MKLWEQVAEKLSEGVGRRLFERMEAENALPLPERIYDVVVDDPEMFSRHEYRSVAAVSARAASIEAYRRAMRDEGFRCVAAHSAGDEVTVEVASVECAIWSVVHLAGKHPQINYPEPRRAVR